MKERMSLRLFMLLFWASSAGVPYALAAQDNRAERIYADSSNSVLYLLVKSDSGEILGEATGFVVAGGAIVTNEHVVRGGSVVIDTGAAKVPTTLERIDAFNDLALLRPGTELSAKPLTIAEALPATGASVFAIGNPAGLERTISNGIVSAVRVRDGRELIQVTAPLSPGSSGGPILNANGEVIGVAVAILTEGQNLNFAVPASLLQKLLKGEISPGRDALSMIERAEALKKQRRQYEFSADPDSNWQKIDVQVDDLLQKALDRAGNDHELLLRIGENAHRQNNRIAETAAERAVRLKPTAEAYLLLGKELTWQAWSLDGAEKSDSLNRAETALRNALRLSNPPSAETYFYLADALEDREKLTEAGDNFLRALEISKADENDELTAETLRGLVRVSYKLKKTEGADSWFNALVAAGLAESLDWWAQGKRLDSLERYEEAGESYVQAATHGGTWESWCEAAGSFASTENADDRTLWAARNCISEGSNKDRSESYLAAAHKVIAGVLSRRGVYQEALSHAREAAVLNPKDPFAFDAQTEALLGLRRFQEAINMANQAIRLSDGKYALMHFRLGYAYFEVENWEFSRQSYEKAAELNPLDAAAAFNVALSFARLGYYRDAAKWLEEVLRREPNHRDRQEIVSRIQLLRR